MQTNRGKVRVEKIRFKVEDTLNEGYAIRSKSGGIFPS